MNKKEQKNKKNKKFNTKSKEGNTYIIIVSLFFVEVVAGICFGFIIIVPSLGRKKSLIIF